MRLSQQDSSTTTKTPEYGKQKETTTKESGEPGLRYGREKRNQI